MEIKGNKIVTILNQLSDNGGARKSSMRVGRGIGSGKGKTCGRGVKGQKSRSGVAINGFEGGQMSIYRRLPKRGFNNISRKEFEIITFSKLQEFIDGKKIDSEKIINTDVLLAAGLIKNNKNGVKLLATGKIKSKVTIGLDFASKSAIASIEKIGGKVLLSDPEKLSTKKSK